MGNIIPGIMLHRKLIANGVDVPVWANIHTDKPKADMPDPKIEKNCPAHIVENLENFFSFMSFSFILGLYRLTRLK